MNPMTNVKNVLKLSERELSGKSKSSWHDQYKGSAWVFIGGLPFELTEGDIICVFSQYGEIVNVNLVRDKATGKSRGFAFLCYEDQRSTNLTVDNLNGIKILGRTIRVDHCEQYRAPNADMTKVDELTAQVRQEGCAPPVIKTEITRIPISNSVDRTVKSEEKKKSKKTKKVKRLKVKSKKKSKEKKRSNADTESS